jgi:hypothetical protein
MTHLLIASGLASAIAIGAVGIALAGDGPLPDVWVAEENPSGVFAMFNPTLSCP